MRWWISSGHAADLILVVMLMEMLWLTTARRWHVVEAGLALLPGALLIVALRFALTGVSWPAIALTLAASAPAHIMDLRRREKIRSSISDRR